MLVVATLASSMTVADDYDDPGFSGGNTERPGLKRLMVHLAPDVVQACLTDGSGIALEHLIRSGGLPLDWQQQRRMIQPRS